MVAPDGGIVSKGTAEFFGGGGVFVDVVCGVEEVDDEFEVVLFAEVYFPGGVCAHDGGVVGGFDLGEEFFVGFGVFGEEVVFAIPEGEEDGELGGKGGGFLGEGGSGCEEGGE